MHFVISIDSDIIAYSLMLPSSAWRNVYWVLDLESSIVRVLDLVRLWIVRPIKKLRFPVSDAASGGDDMEGLPDWLVEGAAQVLVFQLRSFTSVSREDMHIFVPHTCGSSHTFEHSSGVWPWISSGRPTGQLGATLSWICRTW